MQRQALPKRSQLGRLRDPDAFLWATGIEDTFITAPGTLRPAGRSTNTSSPGTTIAGAEDLGLIAELGVSAARYGVPWHRSSPSGRSFGLELSPTETIDRLLDARRRAHRRPRPLRPAALDRRTPFSIPTIRASSRIMPRRARRALQGPRLLVHAAERAAHHRLVLRPARLVAALPARLARLRRGHAGDLPRHRGDGASAGAVDPEIVPGSCRRDRSFRDRRSGACRRGAAASGDRLPGSRPRQRDASTRASAYGVAARPRSARGASSPGSSITRSTCPSSA